MKIGVSGSHGLVASALVPALREQGHEIRTLVRREARDDSEIEWLPEKGSVALGRLEGIDALVHLAGESIAEGRWTDEKKRRIRDSRVKATKFLSAALIDLKQPPQTFISASAIGYYGNRGAEILTETSARGNGFLANVCADWEQAATSAAEKGIRVVNARFGVILSQRGGALAKMLTPFRMGVGGRVGSGEQYMSWITLADVIGVLKLALTNDALHGPINVVAPNPVTNAEFTKALGKALNRPTLFPVPSFAARMAFGEMADALLLSSQRVEPQRLQEAGYAFRHAELESGLRAVLKD